MGVPAGCWRLVYRGTLRGGEKWQSGFWLQENPPADNAEAQIAAQLEFDSEGGTSASSLWNVLKTYLPNTITLDSVACYSFPTGGTSASFVGVSSGTPLVGSGSTSALPNQCAMVASLLTGAAGRSHRGRMYLPCGSAEIDASTGQFNLARITDIATVLATKFTDFNTASGSGNVVLVAQLLTQATQVLSVRVDSRVDIQRRRAKSQAVANTYAAAVTP